MLLLQKPFSVGFITCNSKKQNKKLYCLYSQAVLKSIKSSLVQTKLPFIRPQHTALVSFNNFPIILVQTFTAFLLVGLFLYKPIFERVKYNKKLYQNWVIFCETWQFYKTDQATDRLAIEGPIQHIMWACKR